MEAPGCAKFQTMAPGQFFNPVDVGLGLSHRAVSLNESIQCGRLIDYRNTTTAGQPPAVGREPLLAEVDSFRRQYQAERSMYWQLVFGGPVVTFVASWAVFFAVRPVVRWVRAGFLTS